MSEPEYNEALKRLEQLMEEHPDSDEIEQLAIALDAYEKEHFKI